MDPAVKDLVGAGIYQREKGDVNIAIDKFNEALKIETDPSNRLYIQNHLALAYYHAGKYEDAKEIWKMVRDLSSVISNPGEKAVAFRNLSRPELWKTDDDLALAQSNAWIALQMAKEIGRKDLAWFWHGYFSATERLNLDKSVKRTVLKSALKEQYQSLRKVWKSASPLERNVWGTAYLMDWVKVHTRLSKPILKISYVFAKILNLKRREEKIKKMLESA